MRDCPFSPQERAELAAVLHRSADYLYQCLTGRRSMSPKEAVRAERLTNGRLRRWHVCPNDWHETWPELIGAEGAPPVPDTARSMADA